MGVDEKGHGTLCLEDLPSRNSLGPSINRILVPSKDSLVNQDFQLVSRQVLLIVKHLLFYQLVVAT